MGAEMGALVVFKIRITREFETKIRLVMVIAAYFVYSIFLPSFLLSNPASIPFVGWSMGIGTAGAVAPIFLGAILGTYLITGVLSFLFGSRQTCSVFCTAALMYQGTFYDSMKEFNRTSAFGKKLLTSRMSSIYKVVASVAVTSMIIAAILSYLNSVGIISFTFFGTDIAYFLYVFYFNFLWYIIFISIPFVGTYGCVSTGMCHIGLFNQFISRFGLFRLKVKDPQVCMSCETKDCAKACPVGLTDLPGSFIKSGQFRSHKCIGVGDCVSACPYQNEYFYDVRGWLRERIGKGKGAGLTSLPVIGNSRQASIFGLGKRAGQTRHSSRSEKSSTA
jgi:polyferredoxin